MRWRGSNQWDMPRRLVAPCRRQFFVQCSGNSAHGRAAIDADSDPERRFRLRLWANL